MSKAGFLSFIEVGSELESILLEAKLITQLKPFYNLISKDDKTPYYIHVTDRPVINHQSIKAIAGPFLNRLMPLRILKYFRHLAPYCTAPKSQKNSCLYSHLGLCNPCPHGPNFSITGYRQNIRHLKLLLLGKFGQFRKSQIRYMNIYSQNQEYEKAQVIKNHLD